MIENENNSAPDQTAEIRDSLIQSVRDRMGDDLYEQFLSHVSEMNRNKLLKSVQDGFLDVVSADATHPDTALHELESDVIEHIVDGVKRQVQNFDFSKRHKEKSPTPDFLLKQRLSNADHGKRSSFIHQNINITTIPSQQADTIEEDFVFISYKSGEWEEVFKKYVIPLHVKYGMNVYCDASFDSENDNWTQQMERHITSAHCKAVLCFLSKGYLGSYATLLELMANRLNRNYGHSKMFKPLIPIILDDDNQWESYYFHNTDPVGVPESGPEKAKLDEYLRRFQIVLNHDKDTLESLHKDSLINDISIMLNEKNYSHRINKFVTYEYITALIKLSSDPSRNYYVNHEPETFFKKLTATIESAIKGDQSHNDLPSGVFSGKKDPSFDVCHFIAENKPEDFVFREKTNQLVSYRGTSSRVTLPQEITSIAGSVFESHTFSEIHFGQRVSQIQDYAFSRCVNLGEISLPHSLRDLGAYAFQSCVNLTQISFPPLLNQLKNHTFKGCTSLTEVHIPDTIEHIGDHVFLDCRNLTKVVLPETLISVGTGLFQGCTGLKSIRLPASLAGLGHEMFDRCANLEQITLPKGLTVIPQGAFRDCSTLEEIVIPEGVEAIYIGAFQACTNLRHVTLPSTLKFLGDDAFKHCKNLRSIHFPSGLRFCGKGAFYGCSSLQKVTIPPRVTQLYYGTFAYCDQLRTVELHDKITQIGGTVGLLGLNAMSQVEEPYLIAQSFLQEENEVREENEESEEGEKNTNTTPERAVGTFEHCTSLVLSTIPLSVTILDKNAFRSCHSLQHLSLGKRTSVMESSFEDCIRLETVSQLDKFDEDKYYPGMDFHSYPHRIIVGTRAFWGCTSLRWIQLSDEVENIFPEAFAACGNLVEFDMPSSVASYNRYGGEDKPSYGIFADCTKLGRVTLSQSFIQIPPAMFQNCTSLTTVSLSEQTKSIDSDAFQGCSSLETLVLPDTLTSLTVGAFSGCDHLSQVDCDVEEMVDNGVNLVAGFLGTPWATAQFPSDADDFILFEEKLLGYVGTAEEITMPETVSYIGNHAFANNSTLKRVVVPSTVAELGGGVFSHCSALTSVVLHCPITTLPSEIFAHCSALKSVDLPPILHSINDSAFAYCTSLVTCSLPQSLKRLLKNVFQGCTSLKHISFPQEITYLGRFLFSGCTSLEEVFLPPSLEKLEFNMFEGCCNLQAIQIPEPVTSIGPDCFAHCTSLTEVVLPEQLEIIGGGGFLGCTSLTSMVLPENIKSVQGAAFAHCTSLCQINWPDHVDAEDWYASQPYPHFYQCNQLTEVQVNVRKCNDLLEIFATTPWLDAQRSEDEDGFCIIDGHLILCEKWEDHVVVPEGVTSISNMAFHENNTLVELTLPHSLTAIADNCFEGLKSLTRVHLPPTLTAIGDFAFSYCTNLKDCIFPPSLTSIGDNAFQKCGFTQITIPNSVKKLGKTAFGSCASLSQVVLESQEIELGNAFIGCKALTHLNTPPLIQIPYGTTVITKGSFRGCSAMTKIQLPNTVHTIEKNAFRSCKNLKEIILPPSLKFIGQSAFAECTQLTKVNLPPSLKLIGLAAFYQCRSLTSIHIPDSVEMVGCGAFAECESLTEVSLPATISKLGYHLFHDCNKLDLPYTPTPEEDCPTGILKDEDGDVIYDFVQFSFTYCDDFYKEQSYFGESFAGGGIFASEAIKDDFMFRLPSLSQTAQRESAYDIWDWPEEDPEEDDLYPAEDPEDP